MRNTRYHFTYLAPANPITTLAIPIINNANEYTKITSVTEKEGSASTAIIMNIEVIIKIIPEINFTTTPVLFNSSLEKALIILAIPDNIKIAENKIISVIIAALEKKNIVTARIITKIPYPIFDALRPFSIDFLLIEITFLFRSLNICYL